MSTSPDEMTIPLTGRRPVNIRIADWPVIAHTEGDSWDGRDPAKYTQAAAGGELDEYEITVRQHRPGDRAVVFGTFTPSTLVPRHDDRSGLLTEAGELVKLDAPRNSIETAIRMVGQKLGVPAQFIQDTIRALPPEDLTAELPSGSSPDWTAHRPLGGQPAE